MQPPRNKVINKTIAAALIRIFIVESASKVNQSIVFRH
jgi:hypothetical protein